MHYLLFYEKSPDHESRRAAHQAPHLEHVLSAMKRGELLMAGSMQDPDNGDALLVFQSKEIAEQFALNDPYVEHGIVSRWHIRPWDTL